MKKLLIVISLLVSMSSFAGKIKVNIDKLSGQPISVDSLINISSMELKLVCYWKTTFYQDLGDEDNKFSTESISVTVNKIDNDYKISTDDVLSIKKYRFSKNKYCLVRFDMAAESDSLNIRDSYMTTARLGSKGNLTQGLKNALSNKTFTADVFTNTRGEKILSRILLK